MSNSAETIGIETVIGKLRKEAVLPFAPESLKHFLNVVNIGDQTSPKMLGSTHQNPCLPTKDEWSEALRDAVPLVLGKIAAICEIELTSLRGKLLLVDQGQKIEFTENASVRVFSLHEFVEVVSEHYVLNFKSEWSTDANVGNKNTASIATGCGSAKAELSSALLFEAVSGAYHRAYRRIFLKDSTNVDDTSPAQTSKLWKTLSSRYFNEDAHKHDRSGMMWACEKLACFSGHPTHPMSKTRLPGNISRIMNSGLEFVDTVTIPIIALHVTCALHSCTEKATSISKARNKFWNVFHVDVQEQWTEALRKDGAEPDDYVAIPIHPLNVDKVNTTFVSLIKSKRLRLVPATYQQHKTAQVSVLARPTVSMRTLELDTSMQRPGGFPIHIKLGIPVQMTSIERYLSPVEVLDSPIISELIQRIVASQGALGQTIHCVPETWGLSVSHFNDKTGTRITPANASEVDELTPYVCARYMSCLLRNNPLGATQEFPNTFLVPLASIFVQMGQGECMLTSMMTEGKSQVCDKESAISFFKNYARVVMEGQLSLFVGYGVSLEAHQQNTLLGFSEITGQLQYIACKEVAGGIYIVSSMLDAMKLTFTRRLHERQDSVCEDPTTPCNQLIHTLFKSHLLPVLTAIVTHWCHDPQDRQTVRHNLLVYLRDLVETKLEWAQRLHDAVVGAEEDRAVCKEFREYVRVRLLKQEWSHKALLKMRFLKTHGEKYLPSPNPFAFEGLTTITMVPPIASKCEREPRTPIDIC
eukprot:m.276736 g.276736  ORF g.276736 m.276736 type:complete len:755 (+) comp125980_c0_seq1:102-2366(+)